MNIYVTGIGVVSAIGLTVEENLQALRTKSTGIVWSAVDQLMLGAVKLTNAQIIQQLELAGSDFSRTTLLGLIAAKEAWQDNKIDHKIRTGIISATSIGGLDLVEQNYFQLHANGAQMVYPHATPDVGKTTETIAKKLGIKGFISTISTACSSGANSIMNGARLIEANKLDRALVGGSDPILEYNIKGFTSLNIYADEVCRPFDDERKGLNLGEGAAFLLLENERSLSETGNSPLCLLAGWNNATDAFHQTASSANGFGATLTMQHSIKKAKLSPQDISYINAHGTATPNNDLSESIAFGTVFGSSIPPFSSTKGFTGHTLAAAGAIEAVYCVKSILTQCFLPNLHFSTPMKETGLIPVTTFQSARVENVLSNSFGFGGNCTSLIFKKL